MSTRNFTPEIWSSVLLTELRNALIYGSPTVINRNYEGEVAEAGDTVRITSIGRPTIVDYVPGSKTLVPEALQTAQRTLIVDQAKAFAFEVDDVDARQQASTFMTESMGQAAYALADVVDRYLAGFYTAIPSAQNIGSVTIDHTPTTSDEWAKVYDNILIPLKVMLDKLNVAQLGRYVIFPAWLHGAILRDGRFIKADESADPSALRQGFVGRAAGFDILMSNNVPEPTTNNFVVQAGVNTAITFVEQINKTEAYRPEAGFSDAIKGLALYGAKLIRPDSLVRATAIYQA